MLASKKTLSSFPFERSWDFHGSACKQGRFCVIIYAQWALSPVSNHDVFPPFVHCLGTYWHIYFSPPAINFLLTGQTSHNAWVCLLFHSICRLLYEVTSLLCERTYKSDARTGCCAFISCCRPFFSSLSGSWSFSREFLPAGPLKCLTLARPRIWF